MESFQGKHQEGPGYTEPTKLSSLWNVWLILILMGIAMAAIFVYAIKMGGPVDLVEGYSGVTSFGSRVYLNAEDYEINEYLGTGEVYSRGRKGHTKVTVMDRYVITLKGEHQIDVLVPTGKLSEGKVDLYGKCLSVGAYEGTWVSDHYFKVMNKTTAEYKQIVFGSLALSIFFFAMIPLCIWGTKRRNAQIIEAQRQKESWL